MGYKVGLQFSFWFSHYLIRFSILLRNEYCEKFQQNVMPCPFTGPEMFCAGPNFLSKSKNLTAF